MKKYKDSLLLLSLELITAKKNNSKLYRTYLITKNITIKHVFH